MGRAELIDLEHRTDYVKCAPLRVYVACGLTDGDLSGLRDHVIAQVKEVLRLPQFEVYYPGAVTDRGSPHHSREVTAIDLWHAMSCDLILFIRLQPSVGMGIEAQIAADMLILWGSVKNWEAMYSVLTPLVGGLANPYSGVSISIRSEDVCEFGQKLAAAVAHREVDRVARRLREKRNRARALIRTMEIGRAIRKQRLLLDMSLDELGRRVDLQPWWIESIERVPELAESLTMTQLVRLARATGLEFVSTCNGKGKPAFPSVRPTQRFSTQLLSAASAFTDYSLRPRLGAEPRADTDEAMMSHWRAWLSTRYKIHLPPRQEDPARHAQELTVFLAHAISSVTDTERAELETAIDGIHDALTQVTQRTGVAFNIVLPEFIRTCRDDHGTEIYLSTLERLARCDLAIAIITPPATGLGILARLFANSTVPCLSVAGEGVAVSRMFDGMYFRCLADTITYKSPKDLPSLLKQALLNSVDALTLSATRRRAALRAIADASLDPTKTGKEFSLSTESRQVIEESVRPEWFRAFVDKWYVLPVTTLLQVAYIASELGWTLDVATSNVPCLFSAKERNALPPSLVPITDIRETADEASDGVNVKEVALYLLCHAPYGLPACVLSHAVGRPPAHIEGALAAERASGIVVCDQDVWRLAQKVAVESQSRTDEMGPFIHRVVTSLLDCCEFDRTTGFSNALLKNVSLLLGAHPDTPGIIQARADRLAGRREAVGAFLSKQRSRRRSPNSQLYVEHLILAGCTVSEGGGEILEQAVMRCRDAASRPDEDSRGWIALLARATHARGMLAMRDHDPHARLYLEEAARLWESLGNTYAAAVANWWSIRESIRGPNHRYRLEEESPLVRIPVAKMYCAKTNSEKGTMIRRGMLSDKELDELIARVKSLEPRDSERKDAKTE